MVRSPITVRISGSWDSSISPIHWFGCCRRQKLAGVRSIRAGAGSRAYQVRQGAIEGSNVDLAEEMTQLIEAQRAYTFLAEPLQLQTI
jgi:hypothetical protein